MHKNCRPRHKYCALGGDRIDTAHSWSSTDETFHQTYYLYSLH